jgi:hypothetical protein
MIERIDPLSYDQERFFTDLRTTAQAIGAPFNAEQVRKTLDVFDPEFRRCVVQMKATCQAGSGLYYRFFYKWEKPLTATGQEHGLIPPGDGPIIRLQGEILETYPGATRAGLDFDTGFGLAKVWTFTGGPALIESICELDAIPDAVRAHRDFFQRHGLRHVFFVASDHQQDSMNVYFGLEPDCRNEAWLLGILNETGGAPDDPRVYRQMLASLAVSAGVGTTFRWNSPTMGRWCLYGLNLPCFDRAAASVLPTLPPRLQAFRDQAPTLNRSPQFNAAWSFGRAGFYTKLEKSYAKDADYFLTREMGGDLSHPAGFALAGAGHG